MLKIKTVVLRGDEIHRSCLTEDEAMLTMMFKFEAGEGDCPRCGKPLNEDPDA